MDNLEYAEMLEIPVNTVNVVKKKSLFSRRKPDKNQDLKDDVLASVNSRADSDEFSARADFIQTEDLTEPPMARTKSRDGINGILIAEAVAACLIAGGIFITNALVDNTAINNLVAGLSQPAEQEVSYTDLELSSVVSQLSDTEVSQTSGVISFTGQTAVYPVCEGTISSVTQTDGLYTVEIAHTSTFSSVFTGLTTVYSAVGDEVKANIPFAYSDGQNEVRVSMYDGQTLISGYTLEGAVPVLEFVKITIHPLFFAVIIFCAFFGGFFVSIIFALTALLHECGHVFCAAKLGYECKQIKLMPYGAAAVCDIDGIKWRDEVALALAGPAVNAAICVGVAALWWFFPETYAFTDTIMQASLAMLVVNLLPAYPLDGGRVAKCVLSKLFSPRAAHIILRVTNLSIAAGMAALFIISKFNITFLFFALFLICSALEKSPPAVRINFASRAALRRGVEVKTVIVGDELTVKDAVRLLDDKRYLIVRRESDGKEITQDELCDVMAQKSIYDNVFD